MCAHVALSVRLEERWVKKGTRQRIRITSFVTTLVLPVVSSAALERDVLGLRREMGGSPSGCVSVLPYVAVNSCSVVRTFDAE